jgi:excisionase family DNA binding protein
MARGLLSTGEVARRLGSSRQHVVDLCDRGALPSVRVGVHRRVPADAVEALLHSGLELSREQERSLWLHRAVLGELAADPRGALRVAQDNIARWRNLHRPGGMAERWMDRWGQLVQDGSDAVAEVLVSRTPEAVELRQNTPFAGVLSQQRRREVLDAFNGHWREHHEGGRAV